MASGEAHCKSCGALILWVTMTPSMRPKPLDAVPRADGTIERKRGKSSHKWYGRVVPAKERRMFKKLYVSHFATCEQADLWRGDRSQR